MIMQQQIEQYSNIIFKHYDSLDSTMDEAKRLVRTDFIGTALTKKRSLVCISAEHQEKGRGQHGKAWASPKSAGLYFSLLSNRSISPVRDESSIDENHHAPAVRATQLCISVLESFLRKYCGLPAAQFSLKPLNDIYYEGAKLAGILIEKFTFNNEEYHVVGIGINLFKSTYALKESLVAAPKAEPISLEEIYGLEAATRLKSDFLNEISIAFLGSFFSD